MDLKTMNPELLIKSLLVVVVSLMMIWNNNNLKVANGQIIRTACTSSMISSFTPCLNYLTGSSASGGSPTQQCCDSLKSLMSDSVDCACLIITGNVPVSVPFISRPLAISLPRICNTGVPLRCQATGVPLPPPGPLLFGPSPAPVASSPLSPKASMETVVAAPSPIVTTPDNDGVTPPAASAPVANPAVALGPVANPRFRPVLTPSASPRVFPDHAYLLLLLFLGIISVFKGYFI